MMEIRNSTFAFVLSTAILSAPVASAGLFVNNFLASPAVAQSAISIVVNGIAITNFDIQQKIAFLKLSKRTGNLASIARKELIDDTLRRSAIQRFKLDPTPQQIDEALNNFIQLNHVTAEQFTELLNQNGISIDYFKTYIATQIGWASLLRMRYRAEHGPISQQEAVQKK
ncbi:hypothetical protein [Bartonella sp. DGB2]|uniref:hypothetical protein n=1 Tax=Bartonella sp. DGB2 TaxID=3388426 RepID=UPI0039901648